MKCYLAWLITKIINWSIVSSEQRSDYEMLPFDEIIHIFQRIAPKSVYMNQAWLCGALVGSPYFFF